MTYREHELIRYEEVLYSGIKAAQLCVFELELSELRYVCFMNTEAVLFKDEAQVRRELSAFDGLSLDEYRRKVYDYFYDREDQNVVADAFDEARKKGRSSCYARVNADGEGSVWCKIDMMAKEVRGEIVSIIGAVSNVDRLMRQSEEYRQRAERDSLTRLLNRRCFESCTARVLSSNPSRCHALIMLDLDNFKQINDYHGHREGDRVLRECAEQISSIFRHTDIVGRWGGDEFVVLMADVPNEDILRRKLEQILALPGSGLGVTRSVGVSLFPKDGRTVDELFAKADNALYKAKRRKNSYVIWNENK
ncbi:MAG: GGDEF domain-containing protein [Candidatus Heteroscillospira sp.]